MMIIQNKLMKFVLKKILKYKGGMFIGKKVKFNKKHFNIKVYSYYDGGIRLRYENKTESHDITVNIGETFLDDGKVLLDPFILKNGFIKVLKKYRIIREITGITMFGNVEIPIAKLNMGKLREFDNCGVKKYLNERTDVYRK